MSANREEDKATLEEARPFIRSILAFSIYLRYSAKTQDCYGLADEFIDQLKKDLDTIDRKRESDA
jgi:hypothetical protein